LTQYQRDVFINEIRIAAAQDSSICFISADFGAPALDAYRAELPRQFLHAGISEQGMIDLAAGLALSGRKIYVYAMAPFITLRCMEQLKCTLGIMRLPVTVLAVGVGLGYADSGPTHYATEDLACMRVLVNAEIFSPADVEATRAIARYTLQQPAFRVVRLDRHPLQEIYDAGIATIIPAGFCRFGEGARVCIASCGYLLHRALQVQERLVAERIKVDVVDVFRNKPLGASLAEALSTYKAVVTVEEQCLAGGFGSAVLELMAEHEWTGRVIRLGLPERNFFENGGRDFLLEAFGLGEKAIAATVRKAAQSSAGLAAARA